MEFIKVNKSEFNEGKFLNARQMFRQDTVVLNTVWTHLLL